MLHFNFIEIKLLHGCFPVTHFKFSKRRFIIVNLGGLIPCYQKPKLAQAI